MIDDIMDINSPSNTLSVTTSSGSVATTTTGTDRVIIDNKVTGAAECYVKSGMSGVTAATTDTHIPADVVMTYKIDRSHTHIAAITPTGTTTIKIQRGNGN